MGVSKSQNKHLSARAMKLSELMLEHRSLFVPWHQRNYEWDRSEVRSLLEDLDDACSKKEKIYFLGPVNLVESRKKGAACGINDGQQRIITYLLICAALYRFFTEHNYANKEATIAFRQLFASPSYPPPPHSAWDSARDCIPRLDASESDSIFFGALIDNYVINGGRNKLAAAWKEIDRFFSDGENKDKKYYREYFKFLTNCVYVACIRISPDLEPNRIFEALNCRGKHLEQIALIKNHLFSFFNDDRCKADRKKFESAYESTEDQLRTGGRAVSRNMSDYVRCYSQASNGHIAEKRFYHEFKKKVIDKIDGKTQAAYAQKRKTIFLLVKDLDRKAGIYRDFVSQIPSVETLSDGRLPGYLLTKGRNIANYLDDLSGYTVVHPVLFSIFCSIPAVRPENRKKQWKAVDACCRNLSSFVVRITQTQRSFQPSRIEKPLAETAALIWKKPKQASQILWKGICDCNERFNIVDDSAYTQLLTQVEFNQPSKAKALLNGIVAKSQPDMNLQNSEIEHILPKEDGLHSDWEFDSAEHRNCRFKLGNLTLIQEPSQKPNGKYGNGFSGKQEYYRKSDLEVTRLLGSRRKWTTKSIVERTHELAKRAADVWGFAPVSRL